MQIRRTPTIRSKLLMLVLACVLPTSLMAIVLITHDYQRTREHLLLNLVNTARAMMAVVDRDVASIESSLLALATSSHLIQKDFRAFDLQARNVLALRPDHDHLNITLLDKDGAQLLNTTRPFGEKLPVYGDAIGVRRIQHDDRQVISGLFLSPLTQRQLLAVGVPVLRGNDTPYSLHALIYPERFERLLQQQKLPSEWIAAIFDSSGTIIARSRDMQRFSGKKASPEMLQNMQSGEEMFTTLSHDGVHVYTAISRSNLSNWSLAIGIPVDLIDRELWRTMWWLVLASIVLLCGSIAMAWMIGGRIAQSIYGLREPALALGSGAIVKIPPLQLREADEVGIALVKVSGLLKRAQHLANHDVLTGLANRALFNEVVGQHLLLCERNRSSLAILYIDLDGFKVINDHHGHEVGDKLLCKVAARLKAGSRQSDMVARLGGDEFAIVMVGAQMASGVQVAEKLIESLSRPYAIGNLVLNASASIGVASYPESGITIDVLLQRADAAMYRAKENGRGRVETAS